MSDPIDGEVLNGEALAVRSSDAISIKREPAAVLAEAVKAAQALKQVLDAKPDKVMMNGEQYIENDDWQTIGHFYGISARIVDELTKPVQFGDVTGFEAVAEAITRDGRVVGRAKAMCLNDEEKWSDRPKYDWLYVMKNGDKVSQEEADRRGTGEMVWEKKDPSLPDGAKGNSRPKKERVQTGMTKVPTFQLLSMAQTRASSKVMRMVLGFVPVLAGFKSTPAEELDGQTERVKNDRKPAEPQQAQPASTPRQRAAKPAAPTNTAAAAPAEPAAATETVSLSGKVFTITNLKKLKEGQNNRGPWVKYGIETAELGTGVFVETFDNDHARLVLKTCKEAESSGAKARLVLDYETEVKGRYTNLLLKGISIPLRDEPEEEQSDSVEDEVEEYTGPMPGANEIFKGSR